MFQLRLSLLALIPLALSLGGSHGKLTWFEGSYDELLVEAAKTDRPIFLDYYTDTCAPCRLLDGSTFSDKAVVKSMSGYLCYAIDGNGVMPSRFGKSTPVRMFPTLMFLDSKGKQVDVIEGFIPARSFLREVERIGNDVGTLPGLKAKLAVAPEDVLTLLDLALKQQLFGDGAASYASKQAALQLTQANRGFDTQSVEARFAIANRWRKLGNTAEWSKQVSAILALDPEGKSRPVRRIAFDRALAQVSSSMNDTDLRTVMVGETDGEMLHLGWHALSTAENYRAQRAALKQNKEDATRYRQLRRQAIREAFKHAPPEQSLSYGIYVAQLHLDEIEDVMGAEKLAVLEVARALATEAASDTECLDLFAQWLAHTGDRKQALEIAKRCVQLDPTRMRWRGRVAELEAE